MKKVGWWSFGFGALSAAALQQGAIRLAGAGGEAAADAPPGWPELRLAVPAPPPASGAPREAEALRQQVRALQPAARAGQRAVQPDPGGRDPIGRAKVESRLEDLRREKRDLEQQLVTLEGELDRQKRADPRAAEEFELSAEDWAALAEESRLEYRIPCLIAPEQLRSLRFEELSELGLSSEDRSAVADAHVGSYERVWAVLRPLCSSFVGESVADRMGARQCLSLVESESLRADQTQHWSTRRLVAEIRAGKAAAPLPRDAPPLFDLYWLLTGEAERFERDLATAFGPRQAHEIWASMRCVQAYGVPAPG